MDSNTVDGGNERHRARARRLAAAAGHRSVTEDLLTGEGRFSGTFYLYDDPAVAYVGEDERPRFAFFNHVRGIGVGDERETHSPDTNGIAIALITDERVLGLVGRAEGDREFSLPYDVVTDVRYATGDLHNRLTVETVEERYRLWVSRQFEEEDLRRAVSFVRDRMADPDRILERAAAEESRGATAGGSMASDGGLPDGSAGTADAGASGGGSTGTPAGTTGATPTSDPAADDPLARIEKLHSLNEAGAITDAEYEEKKAELLDRV